MTEKRKPKKRVARTEDRIKSSEAVCAYPQCQGRLSNARIADGWNYCEDECYVSHLMERDEEPDPDEGED